MTVSNIAAREPVRPNEPLAYRVNEFCRVFGLGRTKVYQLIAEGKLRTIRIGGRRLIPREAALALLAEGEQMSAPQMRSPAPRANAETGRKSFATRPPIPSPASNRKPISPRSISPGGSASPCRLRAQSPRWRAWGGRSDERRSRLRGDQSSGAGGLPCRAEQALAERQDGRRARLSRSIRAAPIASSDRSRSIATTGDGATSPPATRAAIRLALSPISPTFRRARRRGLLAQMLGIETGGPRHG